MKRDPYLAQLRALHSAAITATRASWTEQARCRQVGVAYGIRLATRFYVRSIRDARPAVPIYDGILAAPYPALNVSRKESAA